MLDGLLMGLGFQTKTQSNSVSEDDEDCTPSLSKVDGHDDFNCSLEIPSATTMGTVNSIPTPSTTASTMTDKEAGGNGKNIFLTAMELSNETMTTMNSESERTRKVKHSFSGDSNDIRMNMEERGVMDGSMLSYIEETTSKGMYFASSAASTPNKKPGIIRNSFPGSPSALSPQQYVIEGAVDNNAVTDNTNMDASNEVLEEYSRTIRTTVDSTMETPKRGNQSGTNASNENFNSVFKEKGPERYIFMEQGHLDQLDQEELEQLAQLQHQEHLDQVQQIEYFQQHQDVSSSLIVGRLDNDSIPLTPLPPHPNAHSPCQGTPSSRLSHDSLTSMECPSRENLNTEHLPQTLSNLSRQTWEEDNPVAVWSKGGAGKIAARLSKNCSRRALPEKTTGTTSKAHIASTSARSSTANVASSNADGDKVDSADEGNIVLEQGMSSEEDHMLNTPPPQIITIRNNHGDDDDGDGDGTTVSTINFNMSHDEESVEVVAKSLMTNTMINSIAGSERASSKSSQSIFVPKHKTALGPDIILQHRSPQSNSIMFQDHRYPSHVVAPEPNLRGISQFDLCSPVTDEYNCFGGVIDHVEYSMHSSDSFYTPYSKPISSNRSVGSSVASQLKVMDIHDYSNPTEAENGNNVSMLSAFSTETSSEGVAQARPGSATAPGSRPSTATASGAASASMLVFASASAAGSRAKEVIGNEGDKKEIIQGHSRRRACFTLFLIIFCSGLAFMVGFLIFGRGDKNITEDNITEDISTVTEEMSDTVSSTSIPVTVTTANVTLPPASPSNTLPTSNSTPEVSPNTFGNVLIDIFVEELPDYTKEAFENSPDTPQSKAITWLQNDPYYATYPNSRKLFRFILATLYFSTNTNGSDDKDDDNYSTSWYNNENWLAYDECQWYGLTTTGNLDNNDNDHSCTWRNISGLDLRSNNLEGTIIPELGLLPRSLKIVDFGDNDLSGSLPSHIGMLKEVLELHLDGNDFSGMLPSELGNLEAMTHFRIQHNDFSGTLPNELGYITSMKHFDCSFNNFNGTIPFIGLVQEGISNNSSNSSISSRFEYISMNNNMFSGAIPTELGLFHDIKYLDLSFNSFKGTIPSEVALLNNIENLILSDNNIIGPLGAELFTGDLKASLRQLNLLNNHITGTIPSTLGFMTNLQSLELSNNFLVGSLPAEIFNLTTLEHLSMSQNLLNSTIPTVIGLLTNLKVLDLSENAFSGMLPFEMFEHSLKIENLRLNQNSLSGSLPTNLYRLPFLRYLFLGSNYINGTISGSVGLLQSRIEKIHLNNNSLTGPLPTELFDLGLLEELDISSNDLSGAIPPEVALLSNLDHLNLSFNAFTGSLPSQISHLISIREIDFSTNFFNGTIPSIIDKLTNIQKLDFRDNDFVGSLPTQIGRLANLQQLDVSGNVELRGTIPTEFSQLTNLQVLYLNETSVTGRVSNKICGFVDSPGQQLEITIDCISIICPCACICSA